MALSAVELYERLKPHLGEGETKAPIEYVDGKIRGEVATKEDLHLLREDLLRVQAELEGKIQGVQAELEGKIQEVREELLGKIQEVREELRGMQAGLEAKIQGVREELKAEIQGVREEVWKLRLLVVVVLIVVIVLNPKVLELVGRILGVAK